MSSLEIYSQPCVMSFHVETPTLCSNERGIDVHLNLIYFNTTASKLLDCKGPQEEGGVLPSKLETKTQFVFQEQIFFFISLYDSFFFFF